jgi:5-hydroxyisourate hydrolase-like protein (transthyretin family)
MTTTTKAGIAIDLDQLRSYMREFMSEVVTDEDGNIYAWPFETFLQWLSKRRVADDNVLTFKIEKGAGNVDSRPDRT